MKWTVQPLPSIADNPTEEIRMKRMLLLMGLGVLFVFVPGAQAQFGDHVEAGVFADYFRMSQTDNNYLGIGARGGWGGFPHVKWEGAMAYGSDRGSGDRRAATAGPRGNQS